MGGPSTQTARDLPFRAAGSGGRCVRSGANSRASRRRVLVGFISGTKPGSLRQIPVGRWLDAIWREDSQVGSFRWGLRDSSPYLCLSPASGLSRRGGRTIAPGPPVTQTLLATPEDRSSIFPDSGDLGMIPTKQLPLTLGFNDLTGPATCRTLASAQMPLLIWVECRRTLPISFRSNIPTSPR
jgi:hypothetical protein